MPQRAHVSGMNCIHPTAPAELGPMLRPKFDSILLIAARTDHGIQYASPACCQMLSSSAIVSCCGSSGGSASCSGKGTTPVWFGVSEDIRPAGAEGAGGEAADGTIEKVS